MINTKRFAPVLLALGLGLASLPTAGWAAPISFESGASVSRSAAQATSGDFGTMLLEYFASAADILSYYQDAAATEAYLGTACDPPCQLQQLS